MLTSLLVVPRFVRRWLLRPSIWVGIICVVAYWDEQALHGSYVYDDSGSLKNNVVVKGDVPWTEAFTRDFWGTPMIEKQSHKSFRPLTTLSFRLNWILSENMGTNGTDDHTFGFHLVNVVLHGAVTGLITESAGWVFTSGNVEADITAQIVTGLIFALHPVHAEAVSNITSRGELLMSFFFLLAFLSYANNVPTAMKQRVPNSIVTFLCVYIIPWLCMTLSLFCKEQGASALITIVLWDFLHNHSSIREYLNKLMKRDASAVSFFRRTCILAVETLIVVAWRYWLNGESSPDFIYDQNPAGFSEDRFTRVFSVSWVYCLYVWDALYPLYLCPDWSGKSIDLIEEWSDHRIGYVLALWAFAGFCSLSFVVGLPTLARKTHRHIRRVVLMAFFAFLFSPFLLSSNLLVVVGLMKADRVIYLPLMGFCLIEALLLQCLFGNIDTTSESTSKPVPTAPPRQRFCLPGTQLNVVGYLLVLVQLSLFAAKVHERNVAWSHSLNLWRSAYEINPRSHHTQYNCGYELSLKRRFAEAEQVLRPIADPHVEGPSNTFVYAMVLFNLQRCPESLDLIEEALFVVEEKRKKGGLRNSDEKLRRSRSNLLVAKSHCVPDTAMAGKIMYEAVEADPTNTYAIEQASAMVQRVQQMQNMMGQHMMMQ